MDLTQRAPAREFTVGQAGDIVIRHCADVELADDEQVTFVATTGSQFDVVRKSWGYYAGGSLNGRLPDCGLRAALVGNADGKVFLVLVEADSVADFTAYLASEGLALACWLDRESPVRLA